MVCALVSGLLPFNIIEINSGCCVYHSTSFSLLCYMHIITIYFSILMLMDSWNYYIIK